MNCRKERKEHRRIEEKCDREGCPDTKTSEQERLNWQPFMNCFGFKKSCKQTERGTELMDCESVRVPAEFNERLLSTCHPNISPNSSTAAKD